MHSHTVATGFADIEDQVKAQLHHEFGHYLHRNKLDSIIFRSKDMFSPSDYGDKTDGELFAEWYAHYRMKGPEEVPPELLGLLRRFEPRKDKTLPQNAPNYGAAMKLGRAATKEAMKVVDEIGAPTLTESQKQNIRELADALGIPRKEIKPMSFLDADQGISNPTKDIENCQSVVVAFEARRRGLDCYALPYSSHLNSASFKLGERFQDAWVNPKTGKIIEPTILKGSNDTEILNKLKRQINADGRYLLGINENSGRGHIVSIDIRRGKIIIKDEQINDYISLDSLEDISYLEIIKIDKALLNISKVKSILGFR